MQAYSDPAVVPVIFRCFPGGEVLAVFPSLPGSHDWLRDCCSYQHVGQHGSCSLDYAQFTQPATPDEYADLKGELERIGYRLEVVKRRTSPHNAARLAEVSAT